MGGLSPHLPLQPSATPPNITMSDEEFCEEESVSNTSKKGDGNFRKARGEAKKGELDEQLKEYINEWRKQRAKEEEELKRMKDKQAKRKEIRAEQEKKLAQQKKEEEEKIRRDENERKAAEAEEKKKQLEEAEAKRQQMLESQKAAGKKPSSNRHDTNDARKELSKTREQLEDEKKMALSIKIKPNDLFNIVVQLETDRYDFEQRAVTQDYELRELKERQKVQLRQKAMKKGLDPEALTGRHPPKIRMYSKYERRTDTRTYEDRKTLYEGGWEVLRGETLEAMWTEKYEEWNKRTKARLPKWFGERPGRKEGDPETPEGDEGALGDAQDEEEEEEYEEEEEESDYED